MQLNISWCCREITVFKWNTLFLLEKSVSIAIPFFSFDQTFLFFLKEKKSLDGENRCQTI
jgi:hypothetical protein